MSARRESTSGNRIAYPTVSRNVPLNWAVIGESFPSPHSRQSFPRCADRANFPTFVVESALAHVVKDKTEAAYFRSDLFELRRKLMSAWERFATTVQPVDAEKVVQMTPRRQGRA